MPASTTIVELFRQRVASDADKPALLVRVGQGFEHRSWRDVAEEVCRAARALRRSGIAPGDRVALWAPNRYEWLIADLALHVAGAVNVPIHATLTGKQAAYQILDAEARLLLLAGSEQLASLAPLIPSGADAPRVVTFDAAESCAGIAGQRWSDWLADGGDALSGDALEAAAARIALDDLATILYTSGTTGEPKGVMLTQRNLASNSTSSVEVLDLRSDDLRLTWLPLSHIFARTCDLYTWLAAGCTLVLAESPESVMPLCREVHPTLINGVPYFFEKVQRGLIERGFDQMPGSLSIAFGGRLRAGIAGGAPLPDHIGEFYDRHGIRLLQGYGLTETSPVITVETPSARRRGTVGRPLPEVDVRIADDGEILTRGPHVMRGYWKRPEATAETIRDGWLHTGDLGHLDDDGFLTITGRKKDLIVTSGGKNIPPSYLESLIKADPWIAQVVVIGDRRSYLTALVVPDFGVLAQGLAAEGFTERPPAELVADARLIALFLRRIAAKLVDLSRYEQIGAVTLLAEPFSVEAGELTPSLKLRRQAILERHAAAIEAMYCTPPTPPVDEQSRI